MAFARKAFAYLQSGKVQIRYFPACILRIPQHPSVRYVRSEANSESKLVFC